MQLKKVFKIVRPSVVSISRIRNNQDGSDSYIAIGTGVYIDSKGMVLTAYHVVKDMEKLRQPNIEIIFTIQNRNEGISVRFVPVSMVANPTEDIALLKFVVPEGPDGEFFRQNFIPIQLPKIDDLEVGEEIATIGYPLRHDDFVIAFPDLFHGIISRIDFAQKEMKHLYKNIMLDINARPGNSGGPVFKSEKGELIGIIREAHNQVSDKIKYDDNECMIGSDEYIATTNMVNCIPWSKIRLFYEEAKSKFGV